MASAQKKTNDAAMNELPLVLSHLNISSDTTPKHLKIPLIQSLKSLDRLPAQSVHGSSLSPSVKPVSSSFSAPQYSQTTTSTYLRCSSRSSPPVSPTTSRPHKNQKRHTSGSSKKRRILGSHRHDCAALALRGAKIATGKPLKKRQRRGAMCLGRAGNWRAMSI